MVRPVSSYSSLNSFNRHTEDIDSHSLNKRRRRRVQEQDGSQRTTVPPVDYVLTGACWTTTGLDLSNLSKHYSVHPVTMYSTPHIEYTVD